MRLPVACVTLMLVLSGCLIQPPGVPEDEKVSAKEMTSTTKGPTTSTHRYVPINPLRGPPTTSTTLKAARIIESTTSSTSTTTTMRLPLKQRVYLRAGGMTFYLTGVEESDGRPVYELEYNTSEGYWDRLEVSHRALIDGVEASITGEGGDLTLALVENAEVREKTPQGGRPLTIGGGLSTRTYAGYNVSLDNLLSGKVKLRLTRGNETVLVDVPEGGIGYWRTLEYGVLDTRLGGGRALIYLLDDSADYGRHGGDRYCSRDVVVYPGASAFIVDGGRNVTADGAYFRVVGLAPGGVKLRASSPALSSDFDMTCSSTLTLHGRRYSVRWWGGGQGGSAKLVSHA